jgi:hypothetical protein
MWNFAYPYKLKQLIDLSSQRNMLFTFDGENYGPLLKTPRALVVYARGGIYLEDSVTPASHFDHQKGYFDFWLNFRSGRWWWRARRGAGRKGGKKASRRARRKQRNWRRTSRLTDLKPG